MEITIDLDEMFRCGDACPACSYVYTCDNMGFYEECPIYALQKGIKVKQDKEAIKVMNDSIMRINAEHMRREEARRKQNADMHD